jgi:hypothetical protein
VGHGQPVTRIHARGLPWREPRRGLESTREDCAGEEHARDLGAEDCVVVASRGGIRGGLCGAGGGGGVTPQVLLRVSTQGYPF